MLPVSHPSRPQRGLHSVAPLAWLQMTTARAHPCQTVVPLRNTENSGNSASVKVRACEACLRLSRKRAGCFLLRVEEEDAPTVGERGRAL